MILDKNELAFVSPSSFGAVSRRMHHAISSCDSFAVLFERRYHTPCVKTGESDSSASTSCRRLNEKLQVATVWCFVCHKPSRKSSSIGEHSLAAVSPGCQHVRVKESRRIVRQRCCVVQHHRLAWSNRPRSLLTPPLLLPPNLRTRHLTRLSPLSTNID